MTLHLIVAKDLNYGIGYKDELLAKVPNDLKYFREVTKGNPIIMGRKTFESILKQNKNEPLGDDRLHLVLTQDRTYKYDHPNVLIFHDKREIYHYLADNDIESDVFVIGGKSIYRLFEKDVEYFHISTIVNKFDKVDTYYCAYVEKEQHEFKHLKRLDFAKDEKNQYHIIINLFKKKDEYI